MNSMQRIIIRIGVLLLAICRTVYCWMLFSASISGIIAVYRNVRSIGLSHLVERDELFGFIIIAIYSIVWGIAWWMILRGKPASKRWAIAANLIFIFNYVPALVSGNWRGFLKAELDWWPEILVGIFGIIIFCIPYHGWRDRSLAPQVSPIRAGNE